MMNIAINDLPPLPPLDKQIYAKIIEGRKRWAQMHLEKRRLKAEHAEALRKDIFWQLFVHEE